MSFWVLNSTDKLWSNFAKGINVIEIDKDSHHESELIQFLVIQIQEEYTEEELIILIRN